MPPKGLVDRVYNDQLGAAVSDAEISKYARSRVKAKDPYSEEVGPGAGIMRGIDSWLGENVNQPLADAGYPKVGAGLSAAGSAVADLAIPQTSGDYAGVLVPFGKAGKAGKALEELNKPLSKAEIKAASPLHLKYDKAADIAEEASKVDGHLGKDVDSGGKDPLAWSDVKEGRAKDLIAEHRGKPLKISTSSDLLAHDDYMAQLDPKYHTIEYHLSPDVPLSDFHSMEKYAGKPSYPRQVKAIKKLKDAGFNVKVIPAAETPLDDITAMKHFGFVPKKD